MASTINSKTANTAFVLNNDYVVFNVTVGSGGTITFTYTHNPNATGTANNAEGDFNGLQLAPFVLEPPVITRQPQPDTSLRVRPPNSRPPLSLL